ncbi:unnamed protein product [Durusdinium trenchii]
MQAIFEADGVYKEICPEEEPLCSDRGSRMIFLFSVDNTVTIFAGTALGIAIDRTGPVALCILGGVFQAAGLLLMGIGNGDPNAAADTLLFAFVISGIGGTALMLQSLKLAFIVAPRHFALVMAIANCLVDGSSVVPLGLYRLYVAGLSRQWVFSGYAVLCFLLSMCLAVSWHGAPSARLSAANRKESAAATSEAEGLCPRLHGLTVRQQLPTIEFAFAVTFMVTQVFRSNAYLGVIKSLLQGLGDDENVYMQILTISLPASTLFVCLFDMSLKKGGFAFTFFVVLFLGLTWNITMLLPSLPLQVLGFAAFTNFRGLLFASFFTFVGHSFGNRTFGRINALLWFCAGILSLLVHPCVEISKQWTGDLVAMNIFMLALCFPAVLMTVVLSIHLCRNPAGDIKVLNSKPAEVAESSA